MNQDLVYFGQFQPAHPQNQKGYSTKSTAVLEIIASPLVSTKDEMT